MLRPFSQWMAQEVLAVRTKEIIKEDMRLLETQQKALESGAKKAMRYGNTENLMTYHDAIVSATSTTRGPGVRKASLVTT